MDLLISFILGCCQAVRKYHCTVKNISHLIKEQDRKGSIFKVVSAFEQFSLRTAITTSMNQCLN